MFRKHLIALKILALVALVVIVAQAAEAHEPGPALSAKPVRQGFFIGADLGLGGASVEYEIDGQKYDSADDLEGFLGGGANLRVGYQFAPWFSLSVDARAAAQGRDDDHAVAVASSVIMATFYPGNGGFFIRIGAGRAHVEVDLPADYDTGTGLARAFEKDVNIAAFGLGYEWMINEHYSLGFSFEGRGHRISDFDELEDVYFGEGTFGVSMNYFF